MCTRLFVLALCGNFSDGSALHRPHGYGILGFTPPVLTAKLCENMCTWLFVFFHVEVPVYVCMYVIAATTAVCLYVCNNSSNSSSSMYVCM